MPHTRLSHAVLAPALAGLAAAAALLAGPERAAAQTGDLRPSPTWADVEVEFEGTRAFPAEQLKAALRRLIEGSIARNYAEGHRELSRHPFDPDHLDYWLRHEIVASMRRAGYLRASLGEVRQERVGRSMLVTVPVEEGEFYRLGKITIEGAEHFSAQHLRQFLPHKKGEVADGVAVARWLNEHLKRLYEDSGFIQYEYEVEPEFVIEPGAEAGVANLLVRINEGRRFVIGKVEFKGAAALPEDVLRSALLVREGEVFSAQKLRDSIHRLNGLDLFDDIDADKDVSLNADGESSEVGIVIRVTEKKYSEPW